MLRVFLAAALVICTSSPRQAPVPLAPVVPQADGFFVIPDVAVPPDGKRVYRAVFDATRGAVDPRHLLPALNMAGSELNALGASQIPLANAKFVVVFHGAALDGILDAGHYKAKFGVENPNLPVLARMKQAGVELFVCGQNLLFEKIDPKSISAEVRVASDALIVLMTYQNDGYALLSF